MILCDLPYGTTRNSWDSVIPLDKLWAQYKRLIKPRGAIILTAQGLFTAQLMMSQPNLFRYKQVWVKSRARGFLNAKVSPLKKHEDILVFYKKTPEYSPQICAGKSYVTRSGGVSPNYGKNTKTKTENKGTRYPRDVLYCKTFESESNPLKLATHGTQKPVNLGRFLIRSYTQPGQVVLDNCFGSGSFLVAATLEGRQFIGIELNEGVEGVKGAFDCIEVARARLEYAERCKAQSVAPLFESLPLPPDNRMTYVDSFFD